ncbi:MAG: deoxyhypusine synthase family protein [Candidatus Aenigmatarchaeota archaeon]
MKKRYTNDLKIWKSMTVEEMLKELSKGGFTARRLGEAYLIWKKMLEDKKCTKILTVAGSLVPAGMRNIFVEIVKQKLIDIMIVTTGSILDHDLIEAFGVRHEQGELNTKDEVLASKNINRIYDVFLPNKGYIILEKKMKELLPKIPQKELSSREFFFNLGNLIKDKKSILKNCSEMGIPIFDPGITDSMIGFHAWMYSQDHKLKVNPQLDIKEFLDLTWNKDRFGVVILGGGLPKHFSLAMLQVTGKKIAYGIQITMSRQEYGGVSGASLEEAKSWKKISKSALTVDVMCDVTIALPLLVASLLK